MFVSNKRFTSLISFAIQIASELATSSRETDYVAALNEAEAAMLPGYDLSIDEDFPSVDERLFWSKVFAEVAVRLAAGTVGSTNPPHEWRESATADAMAVSQLLLHEGGA